MLSSRSRELKTYYEEGISNWIGVLRPQKDAIILASREAMRDIALVAGAVAVGTFVALDSQIPQKPLLLLCGILVLIFDVIFIFGYLVFAYDNDIKMLLLTKKMYVDPLSNVLELIDKLDNVDLITGDRIAAEKAVDDAVLETSIHLKKKLSEARNPELSDKEFSTNNWKKIFVAIFALGFLLIALGLVIPHIPKS
jgi:hypothetical protein